MIEKLLPGWTWKRLVLEVLPHLVAVLFFAFLADGFYNKYDDGYKLRQSDSMNYAGMSKEATDYRILFQDQTYWTGAMFSGMPTFQITGQSKGSIQMNQVLSRPFRNMFTSNEELTLWFGMVGAYLLALALGVSPWLAMLAGVAFGLSSINVLYFGAGHRTKVRAIGFMPGVLAGVIVSYRRNLWLGAVLSAFFLILHIAANHLQMTYYLIYVVGAFALTELIVKMRQKDYVRAIMPGVLLLLAGMGSAIPNAANLISTQEYAEYTTRGKGILELDDSSELAEVVEEAKSSDLLKAKAKPSGDRGGVEKIDKGVNRGEGLGRDYILQYSMSIGEWLAIMCPNLYGGETSVYWGDQYFSAGAFYFGAIVIALFLAYFVAGRDRLKWPMLALTLLAIVLSWRQMTPIMDLFIDHVPLYKKFRDTKMMLVMIQLVAGIGAVLAIKEMAELGKLKKSGQQPADWTKRRNLWLGSLGGLFLLFVVFYVSPKLFFDFQPDIRDETLMQQRYAQAFVQQGAAADMRQAMDIVQNRYWPENIMPERIEVFKADVARTLGFLVLTLAAALVLIMGWARLEFVAIALVAVTTWDLWSVDRRYNNEERVNGQYVHWMKQERAKVPFSPTPQLMSILQREEPSTPAYEKDQRRLEASAAWSFGGTVPREYKDLVNVTSRFAAMRFHTNFRVLKWELPYTDAETPYFVQAIGGYHGAKLQRYQDFMEVVLMGEREALADSFAVGKMEGGLTQMIGHRMLNTKYVIFDQLDQALEVPSPSGPAYFVDQVEMVSSNNEEILRTRDLADFSKAIVHEEFKQQLSGLSGSPGESSVELLKYTPERLTYKATSERGGLLVFSEIWYPRGWKIKIDGEEADLVRANYLFRSVVLTPGEHELEMYFEPSGGKGEMLGNAGALFMGLFLLFGLAMAVREARRPTSATEL